MNKPLGAAISSLLACVVVCGQSRHTVSVCDTTAVFTVNDCYFLDSSTIGRLKFEDYRVTNPAAVQFDPALRLNELAALGPSTAAVLCQTPTPVTFPGSPPAISFDSSSVKAQIYWGPIPNFNVPIEFMDVQFSNFKASNGYTSPLFGLRMNRQLNLDGSPTSQYRLTLQQGNPGLENVAGLPPGGLGLGFLIDPEFKTATFFGTLPSSDLLRQAVYGLFAHADSILNAATFSVTHPPPSGQTLWTAPEIISLASQAEPWIVAPADDIVPLGPPFKCAPGASGGACAGSSELAAFTKMLLSWGGEYLGLRTNQSFNVLVKNLRNWAIANAPAIDGSLNGPPGLFTFVMDIAKPLVMLWPTLRNDPALSPNDQQTIENWIATRIPGPPQNSDFGPNDIGDYADSINMADAIRRSDHAAFAFGIQRYYGWLFQMRPDGSIPTSARLSACSATYSDIDIAHMVSIAEMAATQGYDLYSLSVNGKTLETAVQFLLNARDNPALLYQYSKAGPSCFEGNPGDPPDFNAIFGPGNMADLAWMEPYLARFPFSATAARIRTILGSNVAAAPFPLMSSYTGVNATCAFRQSFEFQPVSGAKVAIISGDGQMVGLGQPAPGPLTVGVTDSSGKPLAGIPVSFAVVQGSANLTSPVQVLTGATGTASATVTVASGPVAVTATAPGVSAKFSLGVTGLAVFSGGIAGIGGSVPALTTISGGTLFSIYGQDFVPAGTGRRVNPDELVNGVLPTTLLGVCVLVGGQSAPILDVYPGLINAVAPRLSPNSTVDVVVTTGCGTPAAALSMPLSVTVAPVSPEFLYFTHNANGLNPVAAVNSLTGAYVGPAELGAGFAPAHPGDLVSVFASGFGPPPTILGAPAGGPANIGEVTVRLGSVSLDPKDVLYAGPAPGQLISQLNIRIPQGIPAGNQPLQIRFNIPLVTSLPGAFLAVGVP